MSSDDPKAVLQAGLSNCFTSGLFSDLEVHCKNGDTFKVHKLVLSSQSEVFARAFDPKSNFKESQTGVLKLKEDDPITVKALLEYMYRFDYTNPDGTDAEPLMLFHVHVYAIGEVYAIKGLKDLAKERFKNLGQTSWKDSTFAPAIKAIYETTHGGDRGLRDVAVGISKEHIGDLLQDEKYQEMMEEVGAFGKDLTRALHGSSDAKAKHYGKYICCRCGDSVEMVLPRITKTSHSHCLQCGTQHTQADWIKNRIK